MRARPYARRHDKSRQHNKDKCWKKQGIHLCQFIQRNKYTDNTPRNHAMNADLTNECTQRCYYGKHIDDDHELHEIIIQPNPCF